MTRSFVLLTVLGLLLASFNLLGDARSTAAAGPTIVVNPASMSGWVYLQEAANGTRGFANGPGTAPLGNGSAHMTVDATGRELLLTQAYAGTRLADIDTLAYSTYQNPASTAASYLAISLQLDMNYDLTGSGGFQGRLVFEPYNSSPTVAKGLWQRWDARAGSWWATAMPGSAVCPITSPCTWGQVLASFPNAGIIAAVGGVEFKAGGPWPGFDGNVDAFAIGVSGTTTTYDFEQVCIFDLDSDAGIGFPDLLIFAKAYGSGSLDPTWNAAADFDGGGDVGFPDLLLFAKHYGQSPCVP